MLEVAVLAEIGFVLGFCSSPMVVFALYLLHYNEQNPPFMCCFDAGCDVLEKATFCEGDILPPNTQCKENPEDYDSKAISKCRSLQLYQCFLLYIFFVSLSSDPSLVFGL